jgi:hypothetical protein
MKAKTIKIVLREKVDEWIETITDKELQKEVHDNCIITGGAIASMLLQEDVNDYDVYFTNKETAKKVAEYYVALFLEKPPSTFKRDGKVIPITVREDDDRIKIVVKSQGVASEDGTDEYQYFEATDPGDPASDIFIDSAFKVMEKISHVKENKGKYRPIFLSSNAITLSDDIQLIVRFYGSPEEIHENYDFVHCTNYWVSKTDELVLRPKALVALLTKELVYVGSRYPLASIIRTRKFIKRGFSCNAGQYLKMCWQVSELDLNNIQVLEEQLVGVDAAYFAVLINALNAQQKKNVDFKYNYSYIVELIDRIF